ncbi:hypothetical protein BaRGS_00023927 [Batillaria attramentaria]|uniref:Uncharacterized protein n=1 Tax=Batillaria attramentaria TaxID=370345 RepID=A0ABD0KCM4_9CAEN
MPLDPQQFAATLEDLQTAASPRKKAAMAETDVSTENCKVGHTVVQAAQHLQGKKDISSRNTRRLLLSLYEKHGSLAERSRIMRMNRKTVSNHLNPTENKRIKKSLKMQEEVVGFFPR